MKERLIIGLITLMSTMPMFAQSALEELVEQANEAYELGRFDIVDSLLATNSDKMKGEYRINAYRLLTLSSLFQDKRKQAEEYVGKLLIADPYYTAYGDAPRFVELIEQAKAGKMTTITTASQQAESIEEAPVPVTLITEAMLKNIGARTLKDALIAYVPGMTDIASNEEMNVAMRGIYSAGQEKILILLNGHRLNSYSTNAVAPDYAISLEKVKQIEVLRGPASSIYGGVALTGVVNIITKEGSDVDGFKVKATAGNYGQVKGDFLFGKRYMGLDILAWGSIYNSTGQKSYIDGTAAAQPYAMLPTAGNAIIGAYNSKPTHDLGFNVTYNKTHFLYSEQFAKPVPVFTLSSGFTPYSYDKYLRWEGNGPGNAITSQHYELGYDDNSKSVLWSVKAYFDNQAQQRLQIIGDEVPDLGDFTTIYPYNSTIGIRMAEGGFQCVHWDEYTLGVKAQAAMDYSLFGSQNGSALIGGEFNHFSLNNSSYFEGIEFNKIIKTYIDEKMLATGSEDNADAFLQIKHHINNLMTMNVGVRYDYKKRRLGKTIHEVSPRLALIYSNQKYSLKFSYAKSFVDAPYFYRSNTLDVEFGSEDLLPEFLNSFQLSLYSNDKILKGLMLDLNLYYNITSDVIVFNGNSADNAGKQKSIGVELISSYRFGKFMAEINSSYQRVLKSEGYAADKHRNFNIPELQTNFIITYNLLKDLMIHAKCNVLSKQSSVFYPLDGGELRLSVPSRFICDAGATYRLKNVELSADVYNLLNKKYLQGGSCVAPLLQPGLWANASIAYHF